MLQDTVDSILMTAANAIARKNFLETKIDLMPKGTVVIADAKALAKSTSQKTRHNNADTPPYKKTAKQLSAVKTTKQPRAYNKSKTKV